MFYDIIAGSENIKVSFTPSHYYHFYIDSTSSTCQKPNELCN